MSDELCSPEEFRILEAWFDGKALTVEQDELLRSQEFDPECCEAPPRSDGRTSDSCITGASGAVARSVLHNVGVFAAIRLELNVE